jgi:RNA polymerase sigma-70 factor (ECF subfamily)
MLYTRVGAFLNPLFAFMEVEKELIQACLKQSRPAQHRLYQLCYSELMQISYRYAGSKSEAIALLNNAFIKLLQQLPKYQQDQPFGAWMHRVAVNCIIDGYRADKQYRNTIVSMGEESAWLEAKAAIASTSSQLDYDYLIQLIRELPPVTAHVFNLFAIDGYKHQEIATLLGISENTSKWHVADARKKLQQKLKSAKEPNNAAR